MNEKQRIASSILDYWITMEFLGQDSYETCTEAKELTKEFNKYKNSSEQKKANRKQLPIFVSLNEKKELYPSIIQYANDCKMPKWGNLTFYVGKVKRQQCIESLAKNLGNIELKQAEEKSDDIAIFSFQCDQNGVYIEHSFSLSTLIWSLSWIKDSSKERISESLSIDAYRDIISTLEKELFEKTPITIDEDKKTDNEEKNSSQFDINAITIEEINEIQRKIINTYSKFLSENVIVPTIGMRFQLFKDDQSKEKYDEDNYMGLNHDFFSNDLKMVRKNINNDSKHSMINELIEYICAPYNKFGEWERHNLIHPNDKNVLAEDLFNILNICNAPLGKWPSRYMPSLMQQIAINLAISNDEQRLKGKVGKIFSVNGPPGTGKTTLLKEIIAEKVVEKAIILSQYDIPDNAFRGHEFKHGDKGGKYSIYYPKWYSFCNDRIANCGVLVTSSNNTAVENITKELPMSEGISSNLKVKTDGNSPDSKEMQEQLNEIKNFFSTNQSTEKFHIYKNDNKREGNYSEIYFTGYAKKLFGTEKNDADAWGLIAAPLGKKKNINSFYYDVISYLCNDLMKSDSIAQRCSRYKDTRECFLAQLNVVNDMRNRLADIADIAQIAWTEKIAYQKLKTSSKKQIQKININLQSISKEFSKVEKEMAECRLEYERISTIVSTQYARVHSLRNLQHAAEEQKAEFQQRALAAENSVSIFTKLFRPSKYQVALTLSKTYTDKSNEYMSSIEQIMIDIHKIKETMGENISKQKEAEAMLVVKQQAFHELKFREKQLHFELQEIQKKLEQKKELASDYERKCDNLFSWIQNNSDTENAAVIDDKLIADILSDDEERSTNAQLVNPWTTQRYNREREKLFYLALQMSKEFLLSSKCCRTNLNILSQYWGLRKEKDTDGERIVFQEHDRKAMIGSLLQTLFLLTPVISSTFASVGSLLKDVDEPGVIGTLIIDEAGQAQPQMAVGALYRARRAIIVGDPKQVEPVVTDELNMLKAAYSEKLYGFYKDKSLSVQNCADIINPYGTFFDNGTDYPDWVGCPLLVHRRCISPMYNISNKISYGGIMKQQTLLPSEDKNKFFLLSSSQWINVAGDENGSGDHYVPAQGTEVCSLVNKAFERSDTPNLYIIAPFNKVVQGIRKDLLEYAKTKKDSELYKKYNILRNWINKNIGTVHKFQGKEADEVIFLLGCDMKQKEKYAVTGFVNSNIVNVAVTRAKYRLYVVGDIRVWQKNRYVTAVKSSMDTLALQTIADIESKDIEEEKRKELLLEQSKLLPGAVSFTFKANTEKDEAVEIISETFITSLDSADFLKQNLSLEQLKQFGFSAEEEFSNLPKSIRENLTMGMKLYYLLEPVYQVDNNLDASCCGILFCKATELQIKNNFIKGLKKQCPEFKMRNGVSLKEAKDTDFMLGVIQNILRKNESNLVNYMKSIGEYDYTENWWKLFKDKLENFKLERNKCCHSHMFTWTDFIKMLFYGFEMDRNSSSQNSKIGGVFYASIVGKKLERD